MGLPAGMRINKNGKYEIRFTVDGKRYSVYGNSKTDVKAKETARRKEIEEGLFKPGRKMTLEEYFLQWVEGRDRIVKVGTWKAYYSNMKMLKGIKIDKAGHSIVDYKLEDIEVQHIRKLQNVLAETYSPSGVNHKLLLVKQLLTSATNEHLINWNPGNAVKQLRNTKQPARETIHRALTFDETEEFLKEAEGDWNYNLFIFLLNTGMRIGEAGALMPSDIYDDAIHVHRTISATKERAYDITDGVKTSAGKRTIPLTEDARKAIEDQQGLNLELFGGSRVTSFPGADIEEKPIFRSVRGKVIATNQIDYRIDVICKKAGLDRFTCHAFRDTFATRAIESGMAPKTLQELLGHSDISMTMNLYAHCMEETKREQMMVVKVRKTS